MCIEQHGYMPSSFVEDSYGARSNLFDPRTPYGPTPTSLYFGSSQVCGNSPAQRANVQLSAPACYRSLSSYLARQGTEREAELWPVAAADESVCGVNGSWRCTP